VDLNETLNDGGRTPAAATSRSVLRSCLVVTEVALAMVLLVAAGLLVKTVLRLHDVNPGFNPERVLSMNVWLPRAKYPKAENWNAFYERMLQRLEALPGVEAAGLTSVLPVSASFDKRTIEVEGQQRPPSELSEFDNYFVTPGYLRAMSIPVLRGRPLTEQDTGETPPAVLISEALARKYWPDEDAIGKRIRYYDFNPAEQRPWRTIVGIVPNVKQYGLDTAGTPALYVPQTQMPQSAMTLVVRTRTEPSAMIEAVRREIVALDPEQASSTLRRWTRFSPSRFRCGAFRCFCSRLRGARASCSPPSASTACSRSRLCNARTRSAFAWRSARRCGTC
jgi:hypothetical protein